MRLSVITILSLATSSLAVALVPKDTVTTLNLADSPGGGGDNGESADGGDKDKGGDECKGHGGDKPGGDKPGGDKPGGDKPGGDKPGGDKPGGGKGGGGMKNCKKFKMKAKGTASGWVGQLDSGQLRIGLKPVELTMEKGEIVDKEKRGMWWTPPTETLQCDPGQKPDKGWSVDCDGRMRFQDMSRYFQCEADNKTYNLYKKNDQGVNCGEITLYATGCGGRDEGEMPGGGKGGMPSAPANETQTPQNMTGSKPPMKRSMSS
ncbi:uncharacterized protein ColSpa_01608 [Colletotrichum spaethianum]|uniref:Cell wall mannoprotein PIR1-like C-terminal domain-containing protein n=1 Tax=Colletotrichum spaethianum TaxID=700344 RepID=A0AA37LBR6_9PEZI|nr:uncharacterized protein ColSpa_01608 [Colletotrichum spaethianum]GKT41427.1 hypothetical protein ColSpa_01608 [Colletotrichum spaethianum]